MSQFAIALTQPLRRSSLTLALGPARLSRGALEVAARGREPSDLALRRRFLLDARARPAQRVLDVGCGEGSLRPPSWRARARRSSGIDVAQEPLRRERARACTRGARPAAGARPRSRWPLADASFDVVWAGEAIEHVADTAGWLSELRRVLRSGGTAAPHHPRPRPARDACASRSRARAFDAHFDPRGDHLRFYSRPHADAAARGLRLPRRSACERLAGRPARAAAAARFSAALALLAQRRLSVHGRRGRRRSVPTAARSLRVDRAHVLPRSRSGSRSLRGRRPRPLRRRSPRD